MEIRGKKINFLGDSITYGHGLENRDSECFVALMGSEEGAIVRNYGISGTRIANQSNEPNGWSYSQRYDEMNNDADIVVVFGGTNDYGHGDAPIGTPDDRTPDTFYGACNFLFRSLIEKYPMATVIVMTPLHRCGENNLKDWATLKTYVDIIRRVAADYSLPVLDLWKCSNIQPEAEGQRHAFMPDGLHPNAAGHRIIKSRLTGFIKSL